MKLIRTLPQLAGLGFVIYSSIAFATSHNLPKPPSLINGAHEVAGIATAQSPFSVVQEEEIKGIIKRYLRQNPEVVVKAVYAAHKKQLAEHITHVEKTISDHASEVFNHPNSLVFGRVDGVVTIVEFLDYQCGHCKEMRKTIASLKLNNPELRVVVKPLPIFGDTSTLAAQSVVAAYKQGSSKAWALHEALLKETTALTRKQIWHLAKKAKLNITQLKKDVASKEITEQLDAIKTLANQMQIMGTPVFVIGNRSGTKFAFVPGATGEKHLKDLIDQASVADSKPVPAKTLEA